MTHQFEISPALPAASITQGSPSVRVTHLSPDTSMHQHTYNKILNPPPPHIDRLPHSHITGAASAALVMHTWQPQCRQ